MEGEENVYGESGTAQAAEAEEKEGATILRKFKDVNALAEAYGSLQAEFTRRSQRLRALEKAMENSEKSKADAENAEGDAPCAPTEEERDTIDPRPPETTEPVASRMPPTQSNAELTAEGLYEAVKNNEEARLKIIGEYLSSLKSSGAPVMTGGTGTPAVSFKKPKSLQEAGQMALSYFQDKA